MGAGGRCLAIHEGAGLPSRWGSWEDSKIFLKPRGRLGGGNAAWQPTGAGPGLYPAGKP